VISRSYASSEEYVMLDEALSRFVRDAGARSTAGGSFRSGAGFNAQRGGLRLRVWE
jgi:hypothetical protein